MAELRHIIDSDLGPVVEITIGLSFIQQGRRHSRGDLTPARQNIQALIHTGLATTLVSEKLRYILDPEQRDLAYTLRVHETPMQEPLQRSSAAVSIGVPELGPMFKSVEATFMSLSGPIQCFLGRDLLDAGKAVFTYDGDFGLLSLSASWM